MILAGYNQRQLAKMLKISDAAMSKKIRTGHFSRDDIETLIYPLNIDPMEVFFYKEMEADQNEAS